MKQTSANHSHGTTSDRSARNTRALILDAALRIVSREGLEGLTIGDLAKSVGMSKSGLFAHFGGKDQLQLSVLELVRDLFVDTVMRPAFKAPRGLPRVEALFENWLHHLNDSENLPAGQILIAASIELDDRPGALRDFVQKVQKDLIANIEKAARLAVEEKHLRSELNIELFAWSLYSFVLGYHHFKRMLEDPKAALHLRQSFNELIAVSRASTTARPMSRSEQAVARKRSNQTQKRNMKNLKLKPQAKRAKSLRSA